MPMGRTAVRPYTPLPRCGRGAGGEGEKARLFPMQRTQVLYPYQRGGGTLRRGVREPRTRNGRFRAPILETYNSQYCLKFCPVSLRR